MGSPPGCPPLDSTCYLDVAALFVNLSGTGKTDYTPTPSTTGFQQVVVTV